MLLKKTSPIPLYHQLIEEIRGNIQNGIWSPNSIIPSERELCEMYGLSRGTVKKALSNLVHARLIYQRPGKGTFVAEPKLTFSKFDAFAKDLQQKGLIPSFKLLVNDIVFPDHYIKAILQLQEGERSYKIVRLLLGNGEPFLLATDYYPEQYVPDLDKEDLENVPLWDILVKKRHIPMTRASEIIEPHLVDGFEADKLKVPHKFATLIVRRIVYTDSGPFHFNTLVVRGDKCSYSIEYIYRNMRFDCLSANPQVKFRSYQPDARKTWSG